MGGNRSKTSKAIMAFESVKAMFEKFIVKASEEEEEEEEEEEGEEEEPVDLHEVWFEECKNSSKCSNLKGVLDECSERVKGKSKTTETCFEELIDLIHCADKCLKTKSLFKHLK